MADQETINENVRQTVSFKREFFDKIEDRIKTGGYAWIGISSCLFVTAAKYVSDN